jgi:hypothetical protein
VLLGLLLSYVELDTAVIALGLGRFADFDCPVEALRE